VYSKALLYFRNQDNINILFPDQIPSHLQFLSKFLELLVLDKVEKQTLLKKCLLNYKRIRNLF